MNAVSLKESMSSVETFNPEDANYQIPSASCISIVLFF